MKMDMNQRILSIYNNEKFSRIMNSVSRKFLSQLSEEEIYCCKMEAIWDALRLHDPSKGMRFSSFLYRGVYFKCITQVKFYKNNLSLNVDIGYNSNEIDEIDLIDEIESLPHQDVVLDKMAGFKNSEISEKRGIGIGQVNSNLEETKRILTRRLAKSV